MYSKVRLNQLGLEALNNGSIKNLTKEQIYEVEDISLDEDNCQCYTILNDIEEVDGYYINFFDVV